MCDIIRYEILLFLKFMDNESNNLLFVLNFSWYRIISVVKRFCLIFVIVIVIKKKYFKKFVIKKKVKKIIFFFLIIGFILYIFVEKVLS